MTESVTVTDEEACLVVTYTNPQAVQFVRDMQQAGLKVWHYRGRFYYQGPAVSVRDLQDALSETKVKCNYDQLGLGYVVHSAASDEGEHQELPE